MLKPARPRSAPRDAQGSPRKPDLPERAAHVAAEAYLRRTGNQLDAEVCLLLESTLRAEFGGTRTYVPKIGHAEKLRKYEIARDSFNGQNPTEVCRRLGIPKTTFYRILNTPGRAPRR